MEVSTDGGNTWTASTVATFAAGDTSVLVRTPITDDNVAEPTEAFTLTASEQTTDSTVNGSATNTATILDDDLPTISVSNTVDDDAVTVTEGTDDFAVFEVNLSNPAASDLSFDLALNAGTADLADDFGPGLEVSTDGGNTWTASTVATFAAGDTSVLVRTPITDDNVAEPTEAFTLTASEQTTDSTVNGSATNTATILDDDLPTISVSNTVDDDAVTVTEGTDDFAVFEVNLSNPAASDLSFDLALNAGTADLADDFGPGLEVSTDGGNTWTASTVATFAAGDTSVLVRTPITDTMWQNRRKRSR
ncbi:Calx-beta domain-containing protein [Vreelandella azerica]|uniref:Calx-beta domain-containing protein n=1 Tax=Vreelandella azerica TaxID=2732867 RepID=UPI003BF49D1A